MHELAIEIEQPGDEIGDVAPDQQARVNALGQQGIEATPEVVDACMQLAGVEGYVDAGHQDEGRLAADPGPAGLDLGFKGLESGNGAGDGVLRTTQVEVDDLDELTCGFGEAINERRQLLVSEIRL